MTILKSPISYIGSKRKDLPLITKYEPKQFNRLVDAFGGGGSVAIHYLQSHDKCKIIYNDLDPFLYKLFRILQDEDKTQQLIDKIASYGTDKKSFDEVRKKYKEKETLARRMYLKAKCIRGNIESSTMLGKKVDGVVVHDTKPITRYDKLVKYPALLSSSRLKIKCKDAIKLIKKYQDDPNTFVYLDPPYLDKGNMNPYVRADIDDFLQLINFIKDPDTKCKVMLHVQFNGFIYDKLRDYIVHIYPANFIISKGQDSHYIARYQCILTNYGDSSEESSDSPKELSD